MNEAKQKILLVVFGSLALVAIVFFASTDAFQLFSVTSLSLDATNSKGKVNNRGVDASTGHFKGEAKLFKKVIKEKFKQPKAPKIPQCKSPTNPKCQVTPEPVPTQPPTTTQPPAPTPVPEEIPIIEPEVTIPRPTLPPESCTTITCEEIPQTIVVIDTRDGTTRTEQVVDGITGGGGVASSTTGQKGGFQELIRDKVTVHDSFHTPANGQTVTGTLLLEWGHKNPITVEQFLVPNEFYDWFDVKLPQRIAGEGISFKGISHGEFKYKLTIPKDLIDKANVIPVRLVIKSETFTVDGLAEIQIERPVQESKSFSVAEWVRSLFTGFRVGFN